MGGLTVVVQDLVGEVLRLGLVCKSDGTVAEDFALLAPESLYLE